MFSSKHITGLTALGLAAGAIAAPAGVARPIEPSLTTVPTAATSVHVSNPSASAAPTPASLAYARQDKQLVPRSAVRTAPTIVHVSNPPSSGFDWTDAAIGAGGGVALAMLGIGGAVALSQRRARKPTATPGSASGVATS